MIRFWIYQFLDILKDIAYNINKADIAIHIKLLVSFLLTFAYGNNTQGNI